MSALIIRKRTPDDMVDCVRVLLRVHSADRYPLVWPTDPVAWLTPPTLFAAWVAEDSSIGIDGHIALITNTVTTAGSESDVLVSRLFVAPASRRRRVGRHLTAASTFYERIGWLRVATKIAAWTTPEGQPVSLRCYRPPR